MPNLANAKKVINDRRRKTMRVAIKSTKISNSLDDLKIAYQAIDKAAKRGVIKSNTADRKKSRLSAQIKKASLAK